MSEEFSAMLENVSTIITLIISFIALIFSIISFFRTRSAVVCDFFKQGDSEALKKDRYAIYSIYNTESDKMKIFNKLLEHEKEVTNVISFYDFWSLMAKKHYLPMWTFQASSKFVAVRIFDMVRPYILYRWENQREYACHFEWLVNKIR